MDWIWSPVFGLPFLIWYVYFGGLAFGSFGWVTLWMWANWFDELVWNQEQMVEIMGEDLVRPYITDPALKARLGPPRQVS